jgi:hypothetical protein
LPGYIFFGPLIITRKLVEGVVGGYNAMNGAALAMGSKVGEIAGRPVNEAIGFARDVIEQTLKTGYGCTVKPAMEIAKSTMVDFPTRGLVDNFRTGIKTIFGTVGSAAHHTVEAAKKTFLSPLSVAKGIRDAIKETLWEAPKSLLNGKFKEAGGHLIQGPASLAENILKAPVAIASIPYHIGMEVGLGGLETGMNSSRAMAAPLEGMVNAYRTIGQAAGSTLDYIKEKMKIKEIGNYRERIKGIFSFQSPMAMSAAAA